MTTEQAELGSLPEAPDLRITLTQDRAFDVLANNPARALLYLAAVQQPDVDHTPQALGNRLNRMQGASPGWLIDLRMSNAPRMYGQKMLVPSGLFDQTTAPDRSQKQVLAYRANPHDLTRRSAVAGAMLDWELQFPDYLLSNFLGDTRLNSELSMPATSLAIYDLLLASPTGTTSMTAAEAKTGLDLRKIDRTLTMLQAAGSIYKVTKFHLEDRTLALYPADPAYMKQHGNKIGAVNMAILDTAQILRRQGQTIMGADLFVKEVTRLFPEMDTGTIRMTLTRNPPLCVRFTDRDEFAGKNTRYGIKPELVPAIADLSLRVRLLRESDEFVEQAANRAADILASRQDVAFLMAKAKPGASESWDASTRMRDKAVMTRVRLGSLTLQRLPIVRGWRDRRACSEEDSELFFPVGTAGPSLEDAQLAKAICEDCPVRTSCLQWSLDTRQRFGVAGGMTPDERRAWRRRPGVAQLNRVPHHALTNEVLSDSLEAVALRRTAVLAR